MARRTIPFILLLLVALLLPACVNIKQPYREVDYYTLEYPPPEFPARPSLPAILQVEHFTTSPEYDSEQIIYRNKVFVRNGYPYQRWRARPGRLVRDFLTRDFRQSGLFKAVFTAPSGRRADYALEGSVEQFLEWDQKKQWLAVLTLNVTLLAPRQEDISRKILFQKTFSSRRPAAQKNPEAVVAAMSQAMAGVSAEVIRAVYAAIALQK